MRRGGRSTRTVSRCVGVLALWRRYEYAAATRTLERARSPGTRHNAGADSPF